MRRISVLTPTHNRCESLRRLYRSLEASSYKEFEWIIVDDGSTDDTRKTVEEIQSQSTFPVSYYYQENRGKYIALNRLYELAQTEYCFQIDDDDELLPEAMAHGLELWDSMPPEKKEKVWCVVGRCVDSETGAMVGKAFPDGINALGRKALRKTLKQCAGEKCGFQKVSVVKSYRFPEIDGVKFIFESFLWDQINGDYEQFYTNEAFRIYYMPKRGGDNLSNRKFDQSAERAQSDYRLHKYILTQCPKKYPFASKKYLRSIVYAITSGRLLGVKLSEIIRGMRFREKATVICAYVLVVILRK